MEIYFMNRRAFKSFINKNKFFKRAINSIDRRVIGTSEQNSFEKYSIDKIGLKGILLE